MDLWVSKCLNLCGEKLLLLTIKTLITSSNITDDFKIISKPKDNYSVL